MASGGMMCVPTLMTVSSGIQVKLSLVSQQFKRLQCWNYRREGFMKYAVETVSGA
jgi:hypothetical protein